MRRPRGSRRRRTSRAGRARAPGSAKASTPNATEARPPTRNTHHVRRQRTCALAPMLFRIASLAGHLVLPGVRPRRMIRAPLPSGLYRLVTRDSRRSGGRGRGRRPRRRHRRGVRSFVARAGRMTDRPGTGLARALARAMGSRSRGSRWTSRALFGREAPRTLEIGFGNGESLLALAAARPDEDFLGIEVHRPGVGHLMLRAEALGLTNLRVACRDAVEVLDAAHRRRDAGRRAALFPGSVAEEAASQAPHRAAVIRRPRGPEAQARRPVPARHRLAALRGADARGRRSMRDCSRTSSARATRRDRTAGR